MTPTIHQRSRPLRLLGRRYVWVGGIFVLAALAAAAFVESQYGVLQQRPSDGLPTGPITSQYIGSRPEVHLYYPNSTVVKTELEGQAPDQGGFYRPRPAYASTYLEAMASSDQLINWYREQLPKRGWHLTRQQDFLTLEFTRGDRESFDVHVYGNHTPNGVPYHGNGTAYQTYYQVAAFR